MKPLEGVRLELTKLIWKKWQYIWCLIKDKLNERFYTISNEYYWKIFYYIEPLDLPYSRYQFQIESEFETIGHPATLSDFHKFIWPEWFTQHMGYIKLQGKWSGIKLQYDVMKEFLEQDDSVLESIALFIKENR